MKKIVVIGPESTGKSTLCEELAEHYNTVWCPEYAREYLLQHGTDYTYNDLTTIANGQLLLEAEVAKAVRNNMFIVDTDLYVMKVWYEVAFAHCPTWILKALATAHCDLYLLCSTDLPWAQDALREYPELKTRQRLFGMYKDILIHSGIPWIEIRGTERQRLQSAVQAIDHFFHTKQ
ncbi:ATP-binding protein [Flavisolibacter sp. BT320]|nr:ATP-binding protein [Flavisolibacter longurius]